MRSGISTALSLGLGLGLLPVTGMAHHSFAAEFSRDLPIAITGTVTKVEWTNPHTRFYVDVEDTGGEVVNWDLELGSPNVLMRRGWKRTDLQPGDLVTVKGFRSRNEPYVANASEVVLVENGKRLFE